MLQYLVFGFGAVKDSDMLADIRRAALRRALDDRGMTPTDLARKCGWRHPTKLYNFLNGISQSLSTETYEQIVRQMPGLTILDLLGDRTARKGNFPVLVRTFAQGNHFREQFSLPAAQIKELPLPVDDSARQAGAFAAIVKRPGAEEIFPEKTILLCVPIARFVGPLVKGNRLLIERFVDSKIEVTVREIQEDSDGKLWLSQRSTDPKLAGAVKLPNEISAKPWQSSGERYAVAAVITNAFVPQL